MVRDRQSVVPAMSIPNLNAGVDLSPEAIKARQEAARRDTSSAGATGREMGERAGRVLEQAMKLRDSTTRKSYGSVRRRQAAIAQSEDALLTASVQIRIAEQTPLDKGYLHHLSMEQIQNIRADVARIAAVDIAALAVDAHRRVQQEKARRQRTMIGDRE